MKDIRQITLPTFNLLLEKGDYMFPGLGGLGGRGGLSPKKMKGMLKNMGIDIDELENVSEVIIRMPDKEIVITNPSVAIMDSHGTRSYQISGDATERAASSGAQETAEEPPLEIPDSDVQLVAAQTGANLPEAKAALQEAKGDLAAAIIKLASK
jgi:nascent polypeptide-associated complex subunit alpha